MSRLYGVVSHAALRKTLKLYRNEPFCSCCTAKQTNTDDVGVHADGKTLKRRRRQRRKKKKREPPPDLHTGLLAFLQQNHLAVFAIEEYIETVDVTGRIDCIFLRQTDKKTLFVVDWKFTKSIPDNLYMDYVLQLNLYRYMMKRLAKYAGYEIELYCLMFSYYEPEKLKIFKAEHLPDDFIASLITMSYF